MSPRSRYILVIENLSTYTRSKDIMKEMERYGRIYDVERDIKERIALVEFKRSDDAEYAWRKADGTSMDGRQWRVDWATKKDIEFMGWKWTEGDDDQSPSRRSRSSSPVGKHHRADSGEKQEA